MAKFFFLSLFLFLSLPFLALAQGNQAAPLTPAEFSQTIALPATDIRVIIARIINVALGFLGIVALIIVLYGGFLWMTSGGNEEKISKAKRLLINGAIGLAIILSAFAIARFIFKVLGVGEEGAPAPAPPSPPGVVSGGALGQGIIESHYPFRGQKDVPRNTKIVITFKEPVDIKSLASTTLFKDGQPVYILESGGNKQTPTTTEDGKTVSALTLNKNILIFRSDKEKLEDGYLPPENIYLSFTSDLRTIILSPKDLLGQSDKNVPYLIYLCGTKKPPAKECQGGIKLLNGQPAFQGAFSDYQWFFETGTFLDLTPPTIVSIFPIFDNEKDEPGKINDKKDKPANAMIQINFSEPILPTVASGKSEVDDERGGYKPGTFQILKVQDIKTLKFVAGEWKIGNQYKTLEFVPDVLCARNACGQDVYCLPKDTQIFVYAKSGNLATPVQGFLSDSQMQGLEDLAGNVLDGNKDNKPQGSTSTLENYYYLNTQKGQSDDVKWSFYTAPYIDLTSPKISSVSPGIQAQRVLLDEPVKFTFSKPMSLTTLSSRNISFEGEETKTKKPWEGWWQISSVNLPEEEPVNSQSTISHDNFLVTSNYLTNISHEVKDIYQNCYFPTGGVQCSDQPDSLKCPNPDICYCCNGFWQSEECSL